MSQPHRDPSPEEAAEERFRNLAEHAHDLIAETDEHGRYLYASPNHAELLGWAADELVGSSAFELVHPDDRDAAVEVFRRGVESGASEQAACRLRTRDGAWRWFHVAGRPFRTARGELRAGLIGRDVSEQRAAEEALRESERRFRLLVETASCGIVESDREGRIAFANRAFAAMLGMHPRELIGRRVWDFHQDPRERERVRGAVARSVADQPRPRRGVHHLRGRNGRALSVEIDWNYRRDRAGEITGFVTIATDVTRRERADAALAESHRFITQIAETSPSMLCVLDIEDRSVIYVNSRVTAMLGWDPVELRALGSSVFSETIHPDDRRAVAESLSRVIQADDDRVVQAEYRVRHANGEWRWVHAHGAVFSHGPDGKPKEVLSALEDVTERRRAVDALREQEERFRLLADNAGDVILEFNESGDVRYVSPSWKDLTGYAPDRLLAGGLRWMAETLMHPDEIAWAYEDPPALFREGTLPPLVYRLRHADGRWRWFENRATAFRTAEGDLRGITIARDVTDRVLAEEALRASETRFRLVAENAYDYILELDPDGEITYLSPSFREILGFDPATHKAADSLRLLHPQDRSRTIAAMRRLLAGEHLEPIVYRHRNAQGEWRWLETYGTPRPTADGRFAGVAITRDVTEQREAEEESRHLEQQLVQAQKLESLGVLAGGIAHDFNNLLVGILGNASLALSEIPADAPLRETLEGIETAALRAGELTNQMLAYSGKGRFVVEPLDLSELVAEMAHLLESAISKKAVLRHELARDLPPVDADATQIRQLVMNLITNASDALGDGPGTIALRTHLLEEAEPAAPEEWGPPPGPRILLEVEDSGCGMAPETLSRIFDPFFTTKFTGRGLGLAAALGIVRGHRGAIDVQSDPGRGTRFRVLFPASSKCAAKPALPELAEAGPSRARGTLLVADDEEVVRSMAGRILERAGFDVLTAEDGRRAVEIVRENAERISAVLLDLTMPHLGGEEALRAIREIRPDMPVVLTSGYSESEIAPRFEGVRLEGFLQKPFRPPQLVERMQGALQHA